LFLKPGRFFKKQEKRTYEGEYLKVKKIEHKKKNLPIFFPLRIFFRLIGKGKRGNFPLFGGENLFLFISNFSR